METTTIRRLASLGVVWLSAAGPAAHGQDSMTVLGPSNADLHAGALLLKQGEAEEGLARTLRGLEYASSPMEEVAGLSNVCAAHVMLGRYEEALGWCSDALAIRDRHWRALVNRSVAYLKLGRFEESAADLARAEELAPGAHSVKLVRSMYLDATDPVAPHVIIDDRRQAPDEPSG